MQSLVSTYYLEMKQAEEFIPTKNFQDQLLLRKISSNVLQHWMLFFAVGLPWRWYSRLSWSVEAWEMHLQNPEVSTFLAFNDQELAGFFELVTIKQETEINFFGLFPESIGKGLGGALLSHAIQTAWSLQSKKVWLHTCTSDHPVALSNYLARGFKLIRETQVLEDIPEMNDYQEKMGSFIRQYVSKNW